MSTRELAERLGPLRGRLPGVDVEVPMAAPETEEALIELVREAGEGGLKVLPIGGGYMAGSGWGLGFNVVTDANAYSFPVGEGEYWWDGSSGTRFSIDPEHELIVVIMAAISPSRGGGFREEFKTLVHDAILD